ncbi:MAG: hypothetical protein J6A59_14815, partial [Lachnospiraceae bacterium]|nr:hypothetical protein [Lachnospiraceae bacterium]
MINKNTLDLLNKLGFGADVDALELYVGTLNNSIKMRNPLVSDNEYIKYVSLLRELKPDSNELYNVDTEELNFDQYDKIYLKYRVNKYTEVSENSELIRLKQIIAEVNKSISMTAVLKPTGQQFRAVYVNGWLHKGSAGDIDITRHIKSILPTYIEDWRVMSLVEVRGDLYISNDTYDKYLSKQYRSNKEALIALLSNNVVDSELEYLSYQCYRVLTNDLLFESVVDEIETLEATGLNISEYAVIKNVNKLNIEASINKLIQYFESIEKGDSLDYLTEGIIVTLNDITSNNDYISSYYNHTFLVKLGYWKQNKFKAEIKDIKFIHGIKYLEPYAIIDKVVTPIGILD